MQRQDSPASTEARPPCAGDSPTSSRLRIKRFLDAEIVRQATRVDRLAAAVAEAPEIAPLLAQLRKADAELRARRARLPTATKATPTMPSESGDPPLLRRPRVDAGGGSCGCARRLGGELQHHPTRPDRKRLPSGTDDGGCWGAKLRGRALPATPDRAPGAGLDGQGPGRPEGAPPWPRRPPGRRLLRGRFPIDRRTAEECAGGRAEAPHPATADVLAPDGRPGARHWVDGPRCARRTDSSRDHPVPCEFKLSSPGRSSSG